MQRKLKVDKNFLPCAVNDGDEIFRNGIFHFNISAMISQLDSRMLDATLTELKVVDHPSSFSCIDEDHIDRVDINKPVILAEIAPERYNLIDGNHRVEKAKRSGIKTVPCYKLTVDLHLAFLTEKSAYKSYIEYWNSKL